MRPRLRLSRLVLPPRLGLIVLLPAVAVAAATPRSPLAAAATAPPPATAPLAPAHPAAGATLESMLAAIRGSRTAEERQAAATRLAQAGASVPYAELRRLLLTTPRSPATALRKVLQLVKADVPDLRGRFLPPRPERPGEQRRREIDWLLELSRLDGDRLPPPQPQLAAARDDALGTVALIRALAATGSLEAPLALLDLAFRLDGLFRDECGRTIRSMRGRAIPSLIRAAHSKSKEMDRFRRYAAYQLDRMDRSRPSKALTDGDDLLKVEMLRAYGEVKQTEAVPTLISLADAQDPRVRAAARAALRLYVTGQAPTAPRRRLKLPGGKQTREAMPLYLTYRDFADQELRRALATLLGREPDRRSTAEKLAETLFAEHDRRRLARWDSALAQTAESQRRGDLLAATRVYDGILAEDPFYAKRTEMVSGYLEFGRRLAAQGKLREALRAMRTALNLDPAAPQARRIEAEAAVIEARQSQREGRDAEGALLRALRLDPSCRPAADLLRRREQRSTTSGALFLGGFALIGAGLAVALVFSVRWLRKTIAEGDR